MEAHSPQYLLSLRRELESRCERNPRYSLRSFARSLDVTPATLSRILAGKRVPSYKLAQKLLNGLDLAPTEQSAFIDSLTTTQKARDLTRVAPVFRKATAALKPTDLSINVFRIIADYYHYAILELTFTEDFNPDVNAIAARLGIGVTETKLAIERLISVGLLEQVDGTYRKTEEHITTADKQLTTPALRRRQKQVLEKAMHSLENDPLEKRNMTAMTMAIDPAQLPIAKKMIEEFTNRLCAFLESGKRKKVYELSVGLFPLEVEKSGDL